MKIKRMVVAALSSALILGGFGVTALTVPTSTTANAASTKKYVKTFPKTMRSSWYTYSKKTGYTQIKITSNKLTVTKNGKQKANLTLNEYQAHNAKNITKAQENWLYAWNSAGWLETYGWGQEYGAGSYFQVKQVKKNNQLTVRSTQENVNSGEYYQTKQLAKQNQTKNSSGSKINLLT
ncbi:hypothetical protein [Lactobacillus sp. Sy-1]|uniref:hypothetical protein n=1 Tax=Lactobacillus sp. Sy-1 TaxID=2109645 RepID=UPI001C5BE6EF|nr:hypothetical protein [Lactobacillus sp. Sy-1]MBW1605871.1 hypothetical protein [Lactobacillus sp. Sy-1]